MYIYIYIYIYIFGAGDMDHHKEVDIGNILFVWTYISERKIKYQH